MLKITRVLAVPGVGGYFVEDLAALQSSPIPVADRYTARPRTPGFRAVREVAEVLSVGLVLEDIADPGVPPQVAWGDCLAVAYSGKAGRDPVFRAAPHVAVVEQEIAPLLIGQPVGKFRSLAAQVDGQIAALKLDDVPNGSGPQGLSRREVLSPAYLLRAFRQEMDRNLVPQPPAEAQPAPPPPKNTALRYGVSQALLRAAALAKGVTMAEVVAAEWGLPPPTDPIPIHAQSGGERVLSADRMIARRVESLPHGLVDDIPAQVGKSGDKLAQYVRHLKNRIAALAPPDYRPTIHLDVHGALGILAESQPGRLLGMLYQLESAAAPYPLRVECPVMMESRADQIELMARLREYVWARGMAVRLVVDEWANTLEDIRAFVEAQAADMIQIKMPDLGGVHNAVEAVLACQADGVGAFLGGSCAETGLSTQVSVHLALATRPDLILAKPGMGVDEGCMLVHNEMARALAWIQARSS
jgi:methylaspartate ammonia-lyase